MAGRTISSRRRGGRYAIAVFMGMSMTCDEPCWPEKVETLLISQVNCGPRYLERAELPQLPLVESQLPDYRFQRSGRHEICFMGKRCTEADVASPLVEKPRTAPLKSVHLQAQASASARSAQHCAMQLSVLGICDALCSYAEGCVTLWQGW